MAIGRTFAAMKDYQLDGNKEMLALGTMNVIGSMTSCYVATGNQISLISTSFMSGFLVVKIVISEYKLKSMEVKIHGSILSNWKLGRRN